MLYLALSIRVWMLWDREESYEVKLEVKKYRKVKQYHVDNYTKDFLQIKNLWL